ncbi:MAG: PhzF family phenazine biosynthesis protein [Ginsengibacter sp.]
MNSYPYCVLDVFTTEKYKGNPLAVVFTVSDLDLQVYQDISKEFGYSETSFIYYSKPGKALKVRSFTPTGFEVSGVGHNLLGAISAALLSNMAIFGEQEGKQFVIMKDETIYLSIEYPYDNRPFIGMLQRPATMHASVDPIIVAPAITLHPDELVSGDLLPTVVKTEVAHLMLPVKSADILNKAIPGKTLLRELAATYEFEGVYCFAVLDKDPAFLAEARFFNPGIGIEEDPATGSAAAPLGGFLFKKKYINSNVTYKILQGVKMGQPSVIKFEVKKEGIWISGSAVIIMEGTIYG